MNKYYVTFGLSSPYHHHYVLIHAPDELIARRVIFLAHGDRWAFSYSEEHWNRATANHGYTMLVELRSDDPAIELEEL